MCLYVLHTAVHTDVRIILKCILKKLEGCGLDPSDARKGQLVVSCELNSLLDKELFASQGGLCSIDLYIFDTYFSCL